MLISAAALLALAPVQDPAVPETVFSFNVYAALADSNRDGDVTAFEFTDFVGHMAPISWCVDNTSLHAELILQAINHDELRSWTTDDLAGALNDLDVDGDGVIRKGEAPPGTLSRGAGGALGWVNRLGYSVLLEEGDRNGDGDVDAAERLTLMREFQVGPLEATQRWVGNAKKREPADRNFMSPGVSFFTIESELDLNQDGCVDTERIDAWRKAVDANGDGTLQPAERRMRRAPVETWKRLTDERRALPPLMPWQRSLDDALAVQKRTGQPLLVCVNMDDETACNSLAYWRYRDPAFAKLASGFVCVVASPDDHQPRDYDDRGARLVSPRLGRVLDPEHMDIEPELFRRYFEDRRVAPRHVGIAPDGTKLFDLFLLNTGERLDAALAEHGVMVEAPDFASMPAQELGGYPDYDARAEMERRLLEAANPEEQRVLAAFVGAQPDAALVALRSSDKETRRAAALALSESGQIPTVAHARELAQAASLLAAEGRSALMDALDRAGDDGPAMRNLHAVLEAHARGSRLGAVDVWRTAAAVTGVTIPAAASRDAALNALEAVDAVTAGGGTGLELVRARALLNLANALLAGQQDPRDACAEAIVSARAAAPRERIEAEAIVACASTMLGDWDAAIRAAHTALPEMWSRQSDPLTVQAIRALMTASAQRIGADRAQGRAVRSMHVADAILAGETLLAHPAGTEVDALAFARLLDSMGDTAVLPGALDRALSRFPFSAALHERLRVQALVDDGADSIARRYAALAREVEDASAGPALLWFEGLAHLVAAEWRVNGSNPSAALRSYDESIAAFEASMTEAPGYADSANHYLVLAHAGALTLAASSGAMDDVAQRAARVATLRPASLDQVDGLGRTPRERVAEQLDALPEDRATELREQLGAAPLGGQ